MHCLQIICGYLGVTHMIRLSLTNSYYYGVIHNNDYLWKDYDKIGKIDVKNEFIRVWNHIFCISISGLIFLQDTLLFDSEFLITHAIIENREIDVLDAYFKYYCGDFIHPPAISNHILLFEKVGGISLKWIFKEYEVNIHNLVVSIRDLILGCMKISNYDYCSTIRLLCPIYQNDPKLFIDDITDEQKNWILTCKVT